MHRKNIKAKSVLSHIFEISMTYRPMELKIIFARLDPTKEYFPA